MSRYRQMFKELQQRKQGAFVPFVMLGDPNPKLSLRIIRTLAASGADAVELGIPFSDPIADGPTIQAAAVRTLSAGVRQEDAWGIVSMIRREFPSLPIGLLVYANLVVHDGMDRFYRQASTAGVDSVLVADVPLAEAGPFVACARSRGVQPVMIVPPNASDACIQEVARSSEGYTYVLTRSGVTGADRHLHLENEDLLARLRGLGAPPSLLGFGISRPEHVRAALRAGAAGAISGSAVVAYIERAGGDEAGLLDALGRFTREMKSATSTSAA